MLTHFPIYFIKYCEYFILCCEEDWLCKAQLFETLLFEVFSLRVNAVPKPISKQGLDGGGWLTWASCLYITILYYLVTVLCNQYFFKLKRGIWSSILAFFYCFKTYICHSSMYLRIFLILFLIVLTSIAVNYFYDLLTCKNQIFLKIIFGALFRIRSLN